MPVLAIGTGGRHSTLGIRRSDTASMVASAIGLGYRHIDTSDAYQDFVMLGPVLQEVLRRVPRRDLFLTSKIDPTRPSFRQVACHANGTGCAEMVHAAFDMQLRTLRVGYLDLMLLHRPPNPTRAVPKAQCEQARQQWRALEERLISGDAHAIGVSNFCAGLLHCLLVGVKTRPMVWQQMHHVGMGTDPFGYVSWAARLGIVYQAYSILGGAEGSFAALAAHPQIVEIATHHGTSAAAVAIRWIAQQRLACVLLASSTHHLASNLHMFGPKESSPFTLNASEMVTLSALRQPSGRPSHWGACKDSTPPPLLPTACSNTRRKRVAPAS